MLRPSRPKSAFTLVELLVVIGIIALLIGILLPVLGNARRAAQETACLARLADLGKTLKIYQANYKDFYSYSLYTDNGYVPPSEIGSSNANPADRQVYVWWSVLRYIMRGGSSGDDPSNYAESLDDRFMKAFSCPAGQRETAGTDFGTNMVIMPNKLYEDTGFLGSAGWKLKAPKRATDVFPDNIVMWDATEIPPDFDTQFVTSANIDSNSLLNPADTGARFRQDDDNLISFTDGRLSGQYPMHPGSNQDNGTDANVRWRHGDNDRSNFLFGDSSARSAAITTGEVGSDTSAAKGDILRKFLRPKYRGEMGPIGL
ncbi:MAG: type II secretion system protein [Phycisphaerae bacterium]